MKTFPTTLLRLEQIFSISHEIIVNPSLDDVLHSIVQVAAELVAGENATILLSNPSSSMLNFVVSTRQTGRLFEIPVPIDHSIAGAAFKGNKSLIVDDVQHDPRYYAKVDELLALPAPHSLVVIPLTFRESRIGVIQVINKKQGQFSEEDVEVLVILAAQATIAIEIARLYRQAQEEIAERIKMEEELLKHQDHLEELVKERTAEVHRLAIIDPLTGVFNRSHLMLLGNKAMQQAQRYRKPFSAVFLDIDYFKQINDTYSHATGDEALRKLASILLQKSRSADIAGRYGGEEFVVLMPDTNLQSAFELAERLLNQIREVRIDTTQGPMSFTASIGVVEMDQDHPQTVESLLDKADHAQYAAKHAGRNQIFAGTEEQLNQSNR